MSIQGSIVQFIDGGESVTSCVFSPDGKFIYSGHEDGLIKKWNIEHGNIERTYPRENQIHRLVYAEKGDLLISTNIQNEIKIYNDLDTYLKSGKIGLPGMVTQEEAGIAFFEPAKLSKEQWRQYANEYIQMVLHFTRTELSYSNLKKAAEIQPRILATRPNLQDSLEAATVYSRYAKSCLFISDWKESIDYGKRSLKLDDSQKVEAKAILYVAYALAGSPTLAQQLLEEEGEASQKIINQAQKIRQDIYQQQPNIELDSLDQLLSE